MNLSRLLSLGGMVAVLLSMTVIGSGASSHREAPLISQDQPADNTDVYAFVSPDRPDTVTLIANFIPLQVPNSGPYFYNFGDDVMYKINIDNDGDAVQDIEYQFRFQTNFRNPNTFLYNTGPIRSLDDPNWNFFQTYDVARAEFDNEAQQRRDEVIGGFLKVPPYNIGPKSTPNYEALADAAIFTTDDGTRIFAGPRDDSFYIDVGGFFDLLTIRRPPGNMGGGIDGLSNLNVHTIALQIPMARLTASGAMPSGPTDPNAIIGVWSTTERLGTRVLPGQDRRGGDERSGADDPQVFRQVSRLANPLVNEVVVPTAFKDVFNASQPRNDAAFLPVVQDPEAPKLLNALYGINVPPAPRNDLVTVFLTGIPGANQPANVRPSEQMRLNMAVPPSANPNRMGVLGGDLQGFPNGRRPADDVVDIELRVLAGVLVEGFNVAPNNQLGDGVDANDLPFLPNFPYLATPHAGAESPTADR
jgi:hypothetical protein